MGIPTMRSLTLINAFTGGEDLLPLVDMAPFFPELTFCPSGDGGGRGLDALSPGNLRDAGGSARHHGAGAAEAEDGLHGRNREVVRASGWAEGGGATTGVLVGEGYRKKSRVTGLKEGGARGEGDDTGTGLLEVSVGTVAWKDAVVVLRGKLTRKSCHVQPQLEEQRGRLSSPFAPWVRLVRLSLVLDEVTDGLCAAVADGCPELQEVIFFFCKSRA